MGIPEHHHHPAGPRRHHHVVTPQHGGDHAMRIAGQRGHSADAHHHDPELGAGLLSGGQVAEGVGEGGGQILVRHDSPRADPQQCPTGRLGPQRRRDRRIGTYGCR